VTDQKTVENTLAEGEAADLADKLTDTLHGSTFPLNPAWEDTVAKYGYPPLGVPPICEFHWADTHAELVAILAGVGLLVLSGAHPPAVKKPARARKATK
jgi:hypothetical protein